MLSLSCAILIVEMKTLLIIAMLLAVIPNVSFAQSNLDKFRDSVKQVDMQCPLDADQERMIYQFFRTKLVDFGSLQILEWGEVKRSKNNVDNFKITVRYLARARNGQIMPFRILFSVKNDKIAWFMVL